jgi:hypothetical protein
MGSVIPTCVRYRTFSGMAQRSPDAAQRAALGGVVRC